LRKKTLIAAKVNGVRGSGACTAETARLDDESPMVMMGLVWRRQALFI
jgi:hypothetical protein